MSPQLLFFFFFFFGGGGGGGGGHALFQFLCNLQQYCDSAYNKLNSHQQNEFINITKINYSGEQIGEGDKHARTHALTHTRTHTSKLKFKQLNGPANRSTTILTKTYLHSICMRTMYKNLNACMYVVHRVT